MVVVRIHPDDPSANIGRHVNEVGLEKGVVCSRSRLKAAFRRYRKKRRCKQCRYAEGDPD
jgi:hypothetical protein